MKQLSYRGEIHAIISNVSTSSQTIHKDTRVGQLVITPVVIADFVLDLGEGRGTGAFGSTEPESQRPCAPDVLQL